VSAQNVDTDRLTEALLSALRQGLSAAGEQRLYRSGKLEGLFPARHGGGGAAAAEALRAGLVEVVRSETRGKTHIDWVRVTPRGVDFLHEHESPLRALSELRNALRANQEAIPAWLAAMRGAFDDAAARLSADAQRWLERLGALERRVEAALRRLEAAGPLLPGEVTEAYPWAVDALNYLDRRRAGGAAGDCPLPELFGALVRHHPELSVHVFHEGLRRLHERRALLLRAAEGPGELVQPEYALLDGAAVLYFARR
jgi:hypothetical protein